MKNLKIYLFRHGQTYYNKNKIFTGWKNSHLTSLGKKQAGIIAKKLKDKQIDVAFQTSLSRSKDTLKIILKFHPECKRIITNDEIIERNYGFLEGKSHKTIIEKYGKKQFDKWHRGWKIPPKNGESFEMIEKRVKKFIKFLVKFMKKNKVNVAISAHGNSIRLFRKIIEKASIKETCSWNIPYDKSFEYTIKLKNQRGVKINMKIAIACDSKDESSEISSRGGRAPFYLIFEKEKLVEIIKNPFAMGSRGAGWSVAHMLANKKVDLIIVGKVGSNMETALKEKGLKFKEVSGKVKDFING